MMLIRLMTAVGLLKLSRMLFNVASDILDGVERQQVEKTRGVRHHEPL